MKTQKEILEEIKNTKTEHNAFHDQWLRGDRPDLEKSLITNMSILHSKLRTLDWVLNKK